MPVAEILAGIALVKSSVEFIKSNYYVIMLFLISTSWPALRPWRYSPWHPCPLADRTKRHP